MSTKGKAKSSSKKKTKKSKAPKEPRVTRKGFILGLVEKAGKKGISKEKIVEKTDAQFEYGEGKSSKLRVNNTLKAAKDEGILKVNDDGKATWK